METRKEQKRTWEGYDQTGEGMKCNAGGVSDPGKRWREELLACQKRGLGGEPQSPAGMPSHTATRMPSEMWKVSLIIGTALVLAACRPGGSPDARDYAKAMETWWLEVTGGERPSSLGASLSVDWNRVLEDPYAGDFGDKPLPVVEPPTEIDNLHYLLVTSVFALARAEAAAEREGFYAGLAAGFCNPRAVAGEFLLHAPSRAELLQSWRYSGEECRGGDRWSGNRDANDQFSGDLFRDYQWFCSSGSLDAFNAENLRWKFGVLTFDWEHACADREAWRRAFDLATSLWSRQLIELCGKEPGLLPRVWDAVEACR